MATESTATVNHPLLRTLLADAEATTLRVQDLFDEWTDAQLIWKPKPETWNAVECMDHLIKTGELYYAPIGEAIERAQPGHAAHAPTLTGRMMYGVVRPGGWKVKTFGPFQPTAGVALTDTDVVDRFVTQQETLYDLIRRADGLDLNRAKFSSPVSSLVRLNLGDGLRVMVAHQQRHVQQAEVLRQHPGFPA